LIKKESALETGKMTIRGYHYAFSPKASFTKAVMAGLLTYSWTVCLPKARVSFSGISTAWNGAYSSGNCCRFSRHSLLSAI